MLPQSTIAVSNLQGENGNIKKINFLEKKKLPWHVGANGLNEGIRVHVCV